MKSDTIRLSLTKQMDKLHNFMDLAGSDTVLREEYIRNSKKDFTRFRKLNFSRTATLILGLLKKV